MNDSPLPNLSYCICGEHAIFLDVAADRYFMLPASQNSEFRKIINGESSDFRALPPVVSRLIDGAAPCRAVIPPRNGAAPIAKTIFNPMSMARAAAAYIFAVIRLKRGGFSAVLQVSARRRRSIRQPSQSQSYDPIVAAFQALAPMIGQAENCLPRSIAFHALACAAGLTPSLVIGVKRDPFAAHAWVQDGASVLNDTAEHVRIFTPILVI